MYSSALILFCVFSSSFMVIPSMVGYIFRYYHETLSSESSVDIINGQPAAEGQFPWQVALNITKFGQHELCGGSLISNQWVLTAGHCLEGAIIVTINLGSVYLHQKDRNRVVLQSTSWYLHKNYTSNYDNDVGVVLLPQTVTFNEYIQPIDLTSFLPRTGTNVTVSGWGLTKDSDAQPSPVLNYVNLTIISDQECEATYNHLPEGASCVHQQGTLFQGTCQGDSGGPVVRGNVHVGVISFGHNNECERGQPMGFARTDFYRNWIQNTTGV